MAKVYGELFDRAGVDPAETGDVIAGCAQQFGEQGVVDLMGVNGYYTFLAMVMNTAQTEAPPSSAAPLP